MCIFNIFTLHFIHLLLCFINDYFILIVLSSFSPQNNNTKIAYLLHVLFSTLWFEVLQDNNSFDLWVNFCCIIHFTTNIFIDFFCIYQCKICKIQLRQTNQVYFKFSATTSFNINDMKMSKGSVVSWFILNIYVHYR